MSRYVRCFIFFSTLFLLGPFCSGQGTLEDIRSRLNVNKSNKKKEKAFIDIKTVRPTKVNNWKTKNESMYGIEVNFKVNRKSDLISIPVAHCYFYDKAKDLVDRVRPTLIVQGVDGGKEIEGDLSVKGKKIIRIIFGFPRSFKYKYALVVLGGEEGVFTGIYPKSAKVKDFDFDEKSETSN